MSENNIDDQGNPEEEAQGEIHVNSDHGSFDTNTGKETDEEINESITIVTDDLDVSLSQAINLSGSNIFHEPTCPICSSPYRTEVEEEWTTSKSYDAVHSILKRSKSKVSDEVVNNHMRYHHDKGVKEIQKVEYIDRIGRIGSNNNMSTLERINFALAVLSERLVNLNSIVPDGDMSQAEVEKVKSSETNKIMATYSKYIKMQADLMGEMNDKGEMISIPKSKFINFFNESIVNAESPEEKEIIGKILGGLGSLAQD